MQLDGGWWQADSGPYVVRTADGSFTVSLVLSAALLAVGALVVSRLKDAAPAAAAASGVSPGVVLTGESAV